MSRAQVCVVIHEAATGGNRLIYTTLDRRAHLRATISANAEQRCIMGKYLGTAGEIRNVLLADARA